MAKRILLLLLLAELLTNMALGQTGIPTGRIDIEADSVAKEIDSLIDDGKLSHIVFATRLEKDSGSYFRHYYVDRFNGFLVKCVLHTTFYDYYEEKYKQVVFYFKECNEFKICYSPHLEMVNSHSCMPY